MKKIKVLWIIMLLGVVALVACSEGKSQEDTKRLRSKGNNLVPDSFKDTLENSSRILTTDDILEELRIKKESISKIETGDIVKAFFFDPDMKLSRGYNVLVLRVTKDSLIGILEGSQIGENFNEATIVKVSKNNICDIGAKLDEWTY